VCKQREEVFLG